MGKMFCRYMYVRPLFISFLWHVKRCNIRYLNICIINFPNFVFDISLFVFNVDSLVFKNFDIYTVNIVFSALYYSQFCTFLLCVSRFFFSCCYNIIAYIQFFFFFLSIFLYLHWINIDLYLASFQHYSAIVFFFFFFFFVVVFFFLIYTRCFTFLSNS